MNIKLKNGLEIEMKLFYEIGSTDAWNKKERGYYYSIVPVVYEKEGGYTIKKITAYSGYKGFIHSVKRKSDKAEDVAWDKLIEKFPQEKLEELFN